MHLSVIRPEGVCPLIQFDSVLEKSGRTTGSSPPSVQSQYGRPA